MNVDELACRLKLTLLTDSFINPGTVYADITLKPGYTIGEYYWTVETLEASLYVMFHLAAGDVMISNTSHNLVVAKTFCRLIHCWMLTIEGADVYECKP